jgi:mitogen-activated protein kinase kinase kinase 3
LDNAAAVSGPAPLSARTFTKPDTKKIKAKQTPPAIVFSPQRFVPRTSHANQEESDEEENDSMSEMTFDLGSTHQSNTSSRRQSMSPSSVTSNEDEAEEVSGDETSDEEEEEEMDDRQDEDSEVSSLEEAVEEEHDASEAEDEDDFETDSDESEGEDEIVVWKEKRTRVVIDDVDDDDVPGMEYDNDDEYDPDDDETEAEEAEDDDESEDLELDEDDIRVTQKRSAEEVETRGTPAKERATVTHTAEASEIHQPSDEDENTDIAVAEIIQGGQSDDEDVMEVEAISDDSDSDEASDKDGNINAGLDSDDDLGEEGYDDHSECLLPTQESGEVVPPVVVDFEEQDTENMQKSQRVVEEDDVENHHQSTSPVLDEAVAESDEKVPLIPDDGKFQSDDEHPPTIDGAFIRNEVDMPKVDPRNGGPIQEQSTLATAPATDTSPAKEAAGSLDAMSEEALTESLYHKASECVPIDTEVIKTEEVPCDTHVDVTSDPSVESATTASCVCDGDFFMEVEETEKVVETTQECGSKSLMRIPEEDSLEAVATAEPSDPEPGDHAVTLGYVEEVQTSFDDSSLFSDDEENAVVVSSLVQGNMFDIGDQPSRSRGSKTSHGTTAELKTSVADTKSLAATKMRFDQSTAETAAIQSHSTQNDKPTSAERTEKKATSRKVKIAAFAQTNNQETPSAVLPEDAPVIIATRGRSLHRSRSEGIVKQGHWTLGSQIGQGSFGVVHVGMNTRNGTLMAVKTIPMQPAIMTDVRREIDLLKSLHHKNIVRYYGAEINGRTLHIFQEWVPGGSISGLLSKFGSFSLPVIQSYVEQTLHGLAYLHENNIIHRDIKGSNILVNDEGIVKLADFGASRKIAHLHGDMMMSMTVRGTPYFMAPEVFEQQYSSKADIWAIGCVLFQMATGAAPWKSLGFDNPFSMCRHVQTTEGPPSLPPKHPFTKSHLYNHFLAVMTCCFNRNPSERPTVVELLKDSFFFEMDYFSDDDHTEGPGLFSPGLDRSMAGGSPMTSMKAFAGTAPSPERTPSRPRSSSVGPRRSPFMSPPRPKRKETHATNPLPYSSPAKDTSEWPDWATKNYSEKSASQTVSSGMQDSLALSTDSSSRASEALMQSTLMRSPLQGLQFLSLTDQALLPKCNPKE